jgi:hypothetical protein
MWVMPIRPGSTGWSIPSGSRPLPTTSAIRIQSLSTKPTGFDLAIGLACVCAARFSGHPVQEYWLACTSHATNRKVDAWVLYESVQLPCDLIADLRVDGTDRLLTQEVEKAVEFGPKAELFNLPAMPPQVKYCLGFHTIFSQLSGVCKEVPVSKPRQNQGGL